MHTLISLAARHSQQQQQKGTRSRALTAAAASISATAETSFISLVVVLRAVAA